MGFNQKINDAMNNMSRAVTTQMMQDAPADLKYVYIGPVDEKTRPFCLDAASQGALTEEQILALGGEYAESLVSGGGINCRHNWELASDDIQGQFHRGTQAQKIIEEKLLTKPIEPLNVKSAGKHASVKDAENWAALHVANKVDYSKIEDIKVVNAINKNLLDLKNKGYGFYDKIEPLPARQFKKGIFASTDTVFYYGGLANNHDNLTKLIKKHQKDGWFIKSKNPIKQAIDHEFGHNLTHYHLSRMKDRNRNLGKAISKLKFYENFSSMCDIIEQLKKDELYPDYIREKFDMNNEVFFTYLLEKNKLPFTDLPQWWHQLILKETSLKCTGVSQAQMLHIIDKNFKRIF